MGKEKVFNIITTNNEIPEAYSKTSSRAWKKTAFYNIKDLKGNIYAGSTGNINARLSKHSLNIENNKHLYKELCLCNNNDKLNVEITYTATREEAYNLEQEFINSNKNSDKLLNKALDVRSPRLGKSPSEYNIQRIKETHTDKIVSKETRHKLSQARKGKKLSEETKEKLREINLGKKLTDETKLKISETHKGRNVSIETGRKISESKKGIPVSKQAIDASLEINRKPVICNNIEFKSRAEAAKYLGVSDVTINNRIKNPNFPEYKNK